MLNSAWMEIYQLALRTPGISPWRASSRKQMRHNANRRIYARGRPHRRHRFRTRTLYFRRISRYIMHLRATSSSSGLTSVVLTLAERHAKQLQQPPRLRIGFRRGHNGDLHPPDFIHLTVIDLRPDQLLPEPQGVISPAIEGIR